MIKDVKTGKITCYPTYCVPGEDEFCKIDPEACSPVSSRDALMKQLRSRLDQVARARAEHGSEPATLDYGHCPLALVGVSQDELLAQLGQPSATCSENHASCWAYSFYYLPPRWVGGGPELELYFDTHGLVHKVDCVQTQ